MSPARDRPITIVIADDQALVRGGFRVILDHETDMSVVGEAANGHEAIDAVASAVTSKVRAPSSR